jgi:hypothetical protein
MTKQLYDPHMFNYMWESIVPDDNFIVGTYPLGAIDGGLTLNISRSGNTITINWSGGTLQSADSLPASWADVQGASSPYTVSATGGSKFFRLRQ